MDFKIDTGIPIPEDAEEIDPSLDDIPPPEESSRWVPFKPHQSKCGNSACYPPVGRCNKCGDVFPCPSGNCGHADCRDPSLSGLDCKGNGTEIPDFYKEILIASGQWKEVI